MKGTFPEYESYTFFRSGSHGFPNCIELPAFSVYLSLREKEQRVELLFAAQQCGIPLPRNFISKMAYAIQLAEAEAQRGKSEMKMKMAPNLGDEVVSEVFKAVGDSAAAKRATADAKARSSTQPSQKPEGTGSASSSSASAPKAKAMPTVLWTIQSTTCETSIAESCSETRGRLGEISEYTPMEESPPRGVSQQPLSIQMITGL